MRKQLSEKRKQELRDQLTKARSKRTPAEYKNIYPSVLAKPDDDPLSLKSVKNWIKHNKEKSAAYLTNSRRRGASLKQVIQDKEKKTLWKCIAMAYHADGTPKRSKGIFYPDINMVWGEVV